MFFGQLFINFNFGDRLLFPMPFNMYIRFLFLDKDLFFFFKLKNVVWLKFIVLTFAFKFFITNGYRIEATNVHYGIGILNSERSFWGTQTRDAIEGKLLDSNLDSGNKLDGFVNTTIAELHFPIFDGRRSGLEPVGHYCPLVIL